MSLRDDIIEYVGHINSDYSAHSSLNFYTTQVMNHLNYDRLQSLYVSACAYLICHKIWTINRYKNGNSGLITKEKLGDQEITYSNSGNGIKNNPNISPYYQEFLLIMNNLFGGDVV